MKTNRHFFAAALLFALTSLIGYTVVTEAKTDDHSSMNASMDVEGSQRTYALILDPITVTPQRNLNPFVLILETVTIIGERQEPQQVAERDEKPLPKA